MSNTISDFKSGFNGGTRANRFSVDITWPTGLSTTLPATTTYHIVAAKLPEAELGSISIPYRGRVAHYAGDRDYRPWSITVLDDINPGTGTNKNASWLAFQSWSNLLSSHINNKPKDQTYAEGNTLKTLTFNQLRDPSFGTSGSPTSGYYRKINLFHAWPSEVGQIGLDMGEGGSLVAFTVTFSYDYYNILSVP